MRKLIGSMMLVFALSALTLAQTPGAQEKAEQILQKARAAIGSEAALKSLQGLSAAGTVHRTFGENQMERVIEYNIMLPDKFRRTEGPHPFTTLTVMEGDTVSIRQVPTPSDELGRPLKGNDDPRVQARRRGAQRADFTRMALGWLLMTPSFEPVEYSYAGESKDPGAMADMIDVKGHGNFKVRLYIDQKTHHVTMLTFMSKKLSEIMRMMSSVPGGPSSSSQDPASLTPEQKEKERQTEENWRKEFQAAVAKAPTIERRLVFSKYKTDGGLSLPHHLAKFDDGTLFEEWEIDRFKINPKFAPSAFETDDNK